jgi:hypothetical protein
MDVTANADSGRDTGNTGAMGLSDAINAAINSQTDGTAKPDSDVEALLEPKETEIAGDKRSAEDAGSEKPVADAKTETPAEAPEFEPPQHWDDELKKAFGALPPEGKKALRLLSKNLEGGFTRKSQELSDQARYAQAVRSLIDEPTRAQIAASGLNEIQYLQYLHTLQQRASSDPKGYAKWVIQQLGVSPEDLGFSKPQQAEDQPDNSLEALLSDPEVKQLKAEVQQLHAWKSAKEREAEQQVMTQRQMLDRALLGHIQQFRGSLDDTGQLKYPHFDQIQLQMGEIMRSYPQIADMPDGQEKLAAAYEAAVWAHPELRTTQLEIERKRATAAAEKAREAERAKRVTAVKPATSVAMQSTKPKSLDDMIREAMSGA